MRMWRFDTRWLDEGIVPAIRIMNAYLTGALAAALCAAVTEGDNMQKLDARLVNFSVSSGTMDERDLIREIVSFLTWAKPKGAIPVLEGILESYGVTIEEPVPEDMEEATRLCFEDLFNLMDKITPEGCYFSAHPGNGSDYGFWKTEEE